MRQITFVIVLMFFTSGCNKSATTEPSTLVSVSISYMSGFQGDSLILSCDGAIFERGRGFSDSLFVPSGYLFTVNEGVHRFEMQIPQLNAQADTTFTAWPAYRTVIETSFDRKKIVITYKILYLDTSQIAFRQPPNQSLKLTEPAVDNLTRAKQPATIGRDIPRADWIPSLRHFVAAA